MEIAQTPPILISRNPGPSRLSEKAMMWLGAVAVLAVLWTIIVAVGLERRAMNANERQELTASTAKGFAEYVGLHVLITDRMLVNSRDSFVRSGGVPPHDVLTAEFGQMAPMLLQVAVADATGLIVASSLPMAQTVSIADRPHFQAFLKDPGDRLHVSAPVIGRVSKRMSLQLVRPVYGSGGDFAGVVVASIDPLKLQQYFNSVDAFADGGAIVVAGTDGQVRARFAGTGITWGQSMLSWAAWGRVAGNISGSFVGTSVIDGLNRVFGFHRVGPYPLVVTVSRQVAPWPLEEMGLSLGIGAVLSVYMLLYTRTRVRRLREQDVLIEQLRKGQEREIEANRMKSNFLASISHELRTPLNSILGFSEMIRDMPEDPGNGRFADLIHGSGRHLLTLLNLLLDTAKIEAGRMEVERSEVDLGATVTNLADVHRGAAERKGLTLELDMKLPAGRVLATTDGTKLTQVLNNVLSNAVKFTSHGGVKIAVDLQVDCFRVTVQDTGCGISSTALPTIFDRFSTVQGAGNQHEAGTGLGMSLSRDLMGLLGGSIEVTSEAGRGTSVSIQLPGARLAESQP